MEKTVREENMEEEAALFLQGLHPKKTGATVVALSGDLGAGKTTFVKGFARSLGVTEHITSPTFVIMKIYDLENQQFDRLIHMDAYRLKGMKHLNVLGWNDFVSDPHNLIVVEWPEKIEGAIPAGAYSLTLSHRDDARHILYG